jgi:threonine/homoserine/homoserine lactone efflux protein
VVLRSAASAQIAKSDFLLADWQWMFVLGIFIGSLIASTSSGTFRWKALPDMWEERFGQSRIRRGIVAFMGGLIAMFGARLADG